MSLVIPLFESTNIEETFEFVIECNNLDIASIVLIEAHSHILMLWVGSFEAMWPSRGRPACMGSRFHI